jgi:hypothetical protein
MVEFVQGRTVMLGSILIAAFADCCHSSRPCVLLPMVRSVVLWPGCLNELRADGYRRHCAKRPGDFSDIYFAFRLQQFSSF